MKRIPLVLCAGALLFLANSVDAQLQLKAPGQETPVYANDTIFLDAFGENAVWFRVYQDLGKPWRFIFTGIEAFADADDVPGYYAWDGRTRLHPQDSGRDDVGYGRWDFWGSINADIIGPIFFYTSLLDYAGSAPQRVWWTEAQVYANRTVNAGWTGYGNTRDPDGSWEILGSVIPEAPAPIGELTFAYTYYPAGTTPHFEWEVVRDGDKNRSGHLDETNPGRGAGTIHAPNVGTLNPNRAPHSGGAGE